MIRLTLPYPISANRYWRPVKLGAHISIVPTKEAKAFRVEVGAMARAAGVRTPLSGRIAVHLQLYPHRPLDWQTRQRKHGAAWDDTVQCIDLTNAEKVLMDALNGVAFGDDKQVRRYSAERMEPDEHGARVVLTIEPIAAPAVQGDLLGAVA
ncbi:RusA family crossover junction endodeoxyribonuclease [Variovorax paradoxus]|uniref:RusA family crossover junction endodeoxyribonuclease n=1 Tax=Variovorax paradoxus TaxID=34073 RepID=UPI00193336BF|nr:RusA family crossover junction endodeoxyribonuclease [Variovorax paradoxus]